MKQNGFTLIEILVVLGITIILATGGFLSLWNLKKHQALSLTAEGMVSYLGDVRQQSISQEGGFGWGVHFENSVTGPDYYWRFRGSDISVAGAVDRIALPSGVEFDTISSNNASFARMSGCLSSEVGSDTCGLPDAKVEVRLKLSGDDSSIITIKINAQGTIESK